LDVPALTKKSFLKEEELSSANFIKSREVGEIIVIKP